MMVTAARTQPRMSKLTDDDLKGLASSYITPEGAQRAQIRRVSSSEAAEILNRPDSSTLSGLVFPYFRPGEQVSHLERIRLDSPPLITKNGEPKSGRKYLTAHGSRNRLYFVPGTNPVLLSDITVDVIITEGEKKTIALHRLASEGCDGPQFLAMGLAGVYGWRGQTGITGNSRGERVPVKGPITDLDWLIWEGRRVTLLFDANAATNINVNLARLCLAAELRQRGAIVYLADLPESAGINGIDDYLAAHGPDAARALIDQAKVYSPKDQLAALDFTDFGNERAFEILYCDQFLYSVTAESWLKWGGVCWRPDLTSEADRAMLGVAEARLQAVSVLQDDPAEFKRTGDTRNSKKAAFRAALSLRNIRGRENALRSAQSNPTFVRRGDEFDQNDFLFACGNGVIELDTGKFRPGRREDLITIQSPVPWIPDASFGQWEAFLMDLFPGRPEMIQFLRRAVGYSLTGLTREENFFILHGSGRNGKGVLLRTLIAMLGDHAVTTEFSTLASNPNRGSGPRNDIAALAGRRFVSAQESKEGCRLDEPLIKSLTGGDLITARFLHKEFMTFRPSWKIWLATNHRPEIRGDDVGIWSRPKLIPFTVSFEGREDRGLKQRLLDPVQLAGVLRWAVEGCVEYLRDGLSYPDEIIEATAAYRVESDAIARWVEERCVTGDGFQAKSRSLYVNFCKWATETGEDSMTETAFGRRLTFRFDKHRNEYGAYYAGIGLKPSHSDFGDDR